MADFIERKLFTSESVSEGHPDKVCDQIADAILDECLRLDSHSHVACEVFATDEFILIGGEISSPLGKYPDYEKIARDVLTDIGYLNDEDGISATEAKILVKVQEQSPDIAQGVDRGSLLEQGAGDQGIMFGYATHETEGYMPLTLAIAHKLVRFASNLRKKGKFPHARPDMKSQVTIDFTDEKKPVVDTVVMSVQHDEDTNVEEFRSFIHKNILIPVVKSFGLNDDFKVFINATGRFVIGGPKGDTGLTGRKLIVDTYGGASRHGGGAFSGKDPSKVDRSASYYARYIARNLVAAGVANALEVQLSYAIGVAQPVSISVTTYGWKKYSDEVILKCIRHVFDARPGNIIEAFSLTKPTFKYRDTCNYGCFGRPDLDLPWERLDKVGEIKVFLSDFDPKN